jgi:hypothetical protein
MKTLIVLSVLLLTGCASSCKSHCILGFGPGSTTFEAVAKWKNTEDPCQSIGKPQGYTMPGFCFSNLNKNVQYIYNKKGERIYTVK